MGLQSLFAPVKDAFNQRNWQTLAEILPVVAAKGTNITTFNVGPGLNSAVLPFDTVQFETVPGMVDTTAEVITLPKRGLYLAVMYFTYSASFSGLTVSWLITQAGSFAGRVGESRVTCPAVGGIQTVPALFRAEAGDTVAAVTGHSGGGAIASGAGNAALPWYLAVVKIPFSEFFIPRTP